MQRFVEVLKAFDGMLRVELVPASAQAENIKMALNKILWLDRVNVIITTPESSQTEEAIRDVQSAFVLHMNTPFKNDPDHAELAKKWEIFTAGSFKNEFAAAIRQKTQAGADESVQPLLTKAQEIFGQLPFSTFSLLGRPLSEIKLVAAMEMPTAEIDMARKWGTDTGDDFLVQQIQAFTLSVQLWTAVAKVEVIAAECIGPQQTMQTRRVSQDQLTALGDLGVFQKALQEFGAERSNVFNKEEIAQNPLHVAILGNTLDILSLLASGAERLHSFEEVFGKSWTRDLTILREALLGLMPKWTEDSKEEILSNRPLVQEFLTMSGASLQKLGCLVSELRAQLRLVKKTSIVPSAVVSEMTTFAHHCVATVVYQAVIHFTEVDCKKLLSPVDCKRAVQQLQQKISPKGVELTEEMKACLAEWESGAKLQKAEDTKEPAKKKTAPAVEPPKVPAKEKTEETASAMEVCEAQKPEKKRSLADRAKEAAERRKQARLGE